MGRRDFLLEAGSDKNRSQKRVRTTELYRTFFDILSGGKVRSGAKSVPVLRRASAHPAPKCTPETSGIFITQLLADRLDGQAGMNQAGGSLAFYLIRDIAK